ncbi:bifunctional diaminohydroxyphosphoribosylaminopyrimidine deaminase/5-amino-6-(5-phosphoribosylamino)uracil reductase RibD [Luteipulveratus flavus]|uniref:Riboflavin biosynthesis protein RibD n=2 Tax=Luteipulveratus flavus TaxID=3031728 RepID=A0ABT6C729_9MICO|nr:bifunctional diaminohydroxyphosphoribosylaminopyrimidine deaminase/5-amino-6-(5-phosphoribosylamino)uracil reductase RibD [Luteipulveratus sp. YIM 133296]MDF8264137.1 bifunctional diaminohydroxyphosphoribosylaminopyrimidine deaminase/5-amino-6-(5-phosphoribosylamino)uracil reductase RibD [Luteipulveratus sp. YIM 133296]
MQRQDAALLARAVELATRGPAADANPRVGAVVLASDGTVAGEGWHEGAGTPHAEVMALRASGERARGGTAYVSLEPCAHQGRTPPCVDALRTAGVARVVYAAPDANPDARGGAARLSDLGVEVSGPVPGTGAEELNEHWAFSVRHERPFVTWKVGATLDGRVAAADGTSRWITGAASRADVHRRRASAGAILVGTGTVLADDPALTVRDSADRPADRQPVRVVMGERDVPAAARVRGPGDLWHARTRDPAVVLKTLHDRQIRHLWLEGGPVVAAAFLSAGLVDEVLVYLAPTLLGAGPSLVASLGVPTLAAAHHLELLDVERLDQDVRLRLRPRPVEGVR